jgi:hypothetical protein
MGIDLPIMMFSQKKNGLPCCLSTIRRTLDQCRLYQHHKRFLVLIGKTFDGLAKSQKKPVIVSDSEKSFFPTAWYY